MSEALRILTRLLTPEARLPTRGTPQAAGWDLYAAEAARLAPGQRAAIGTGLAFALPPGWELQLRPRSGLAARFGVTLLNSPGTVDADFRGEVRVLMINLGEAEFEVRVGDRIAQAVVAQHATLSWEPCEALPGSARGEGGFGHTGR